MNRNRIKLLIFDFDGTLARSKCLYIEAIYKTLKKFKYRIPRKKIGKVLGKRVEEVLSILNIKKDIIKIKKEINDYALKRADTLKPCPFVQEINKIEGRKILVSNSPVSYMMPFIERQKLEFEEIIGPKFNSKPEIFRKLLRKYKVLPREAAYIGDMAADVRIAKVVKYKSIVVSNRYSWSNGAEILREKPDAIIGSLKDLRTAIENL